MSLDATLADLQKTIPECLAVGLVDMTTGMLLCVRTVDSHPQEILDMTSAATGDMFQGPNVSAIEELFRKSKGLPAHGRGFFQEIVINSENLIHVFQRGKRNQDLVLVVVCRVSANIGMVLTKARLGMSKVEAAF